MAEALSYYGGRRDETVSGHDAHELSALALEFAAFGAVHDTQCGFAHGALCEAARRRTPIADLRAELERSVATTVGVSEPIARWAIQSLLSRYCPLLLRDDLPTTIEWGSLDWADLHLASSLRGHSICRPSRWVWANLRRSRIDSSGERETGRFPSS